MNEVLLVLSQGTLRTLRTRTRPCWRYEGRMKKDCQSEYYSWRKLFLKLFSLRYTNNNWNREGYNWADESLTPRNGRRPTTDLCPLSQSLHKSSQVSPIASLLHQNLVITLKENRQQVWLTVVMFFSRCVGLSPIPPKQRESDQNFPFSNRAEPFAPAWKQGPVGEWLFAGGMKLVSSRLKGDCTNAEDGFFCFINVPLGGVAVFTHTVLSTDGIRFRSFVSFQYYHGNQRQHTVNASQHFYFLWIRIPKYVQ